MPRHPNRAACTCSVFQNCVKCAQIDCIFHPAQILMVYKFISAVVSLMGGYYLACLMAE